MDCEALGVEVSVPGTSARKPLCSGQAEHVHLGVWTCLTTESRLLLCWSGTPAALPTATCVTTSDPCMPVPSQETGWEHCRKWLTPELCESLRRPHQYCV